MRRLTCGLVAIAVIAATGSALAETRQPPRGIDGAALYRQYCQPCHGADLTGYAADNAPSLVSPTFRETANDAFLRSAIERGRAGTAMGGYGKPFGGPLSAAEIDKLIAFLRDGTEPTPMASRPSHGDAAKGEQVYRAHCQTCHGTPEQRGSAVHLANSMFLATASDAFLRVAIERGRPGTPMVAWSNVLAPKEIEDVVAYVRSLAHRVPPPPPPPPDGRDLVPIENVPIVTNPDGAQASFTLQQDRYVSIADLAAAFQKKQRLVIIDARSPSDYLRLHITGAISIPYFDMKDLDKVPNDGTWVIAYCACPHHLSGIVFEELRRRGYAHSAVLDEGIFAWQLRGYPTVAAPGQLPIPAPPARPAAKSSP